MAKIEDILKAQGFTDEEIAANAALLADPRTRTALEGSYAKLEGDLATFKTENERWANWHETDGKPLLALYEKERADALADNASLKERLRLAEEAGFAPTSSHKPGDGKPAAAAAADAPFDPKKHKLVTEDDIARYSDAEGEAIAIMTNISEEYRYLTGGSLFDYTAEVDGRTLRGAQALRYEAKQARKPMQEYVSQKFDFAGKRKAIEDKKRADAEAALRADERAKVMKEFGDPNVRPLMPSANPFAPRNPQNAKQPWDSEKTPSQLRHDRLQRAMETQSKAGVN